MPSDEQISEGQKVVDELAEKYQLALHCGRDIGQPKTSMDYLEDLEKLEVFIDVTNHKIDLEYQAARDSGGLRALLARDSFELRARIEIKRMVTTLERRLSNFENQIMATQGKMGIFYRQNHAMVVS